MPLAKVPRMSLQQVRDLLDYDPGTGALTRRVAVGGELAGSPAGFLGANGRTYISVGYEKVLAHRLVWFHTHGEWPAGNLSPRDGNYQNLALDNLRLETPSETSRKGKARVHSKSGIKGVSWNTKRQKWVASITRDYRQTNLGFFNTIEEAKAAYDAACEIMPVFVSAEERQAQAETIAIRNRHRMMWRRALEVYGTAHSWGSYEEFCADVGSPKVSQEVVPSDPLKVIGPSNFKVQDIPVGMFEWDTKEGKAAYEAYRRKQRPDIYRARELKRNFGLSLEEFSRKMDAQGGMCACCGKPETDLNRDGSGVRMLAVDHCHAKGHVRDLLCGGCNRGLGNFKDDPELLEKAAAYLRRHQDTEHDTGT